MIDDQDALKTLEKTDKRAKDTGNKFTELGGKAVKGMAILGGAVTAGGTALFGMAKSSADTTDRIDKLSQKIGMSKTGFQEWEYVLSQNGMEIESMQAGMKKLTTVADQAIQGTGRGAEIFKGLGISVRDSNGAIKDQETLFNESVTALQGMEDGTEKARLAQELFGGAGAKLMPLLNGTAEGTEELKKQAHDLGIVLSDDAVSSGAQFTDTMDNLSRSFGAVTANVGVSLMPLLQTFFDFVLAHMPTIQAVIGVVFKAIETFVMVAVDVFNQFLLPVIKTVVQWVQDNMPTIREVIGNVFNAIKSVWENTLKPALDALMGVVKVIVSVFKAS